jgi:hypothetical protein
MLASISNCSTRFEIIDPISGRWLKAGLVLCPRIALWYRWPNLMWGSSGHSHVGTEAATKFKVLVDLGLMEKRRRRIGAS